MAKAKATKSKKAPDAVIAKSVPWPKAILPDGTDITIPAFLRRGTGTLPPLEQRPNPYGATARKIDWAPIKKEGEWEKVKPPKLFVDDRSLRVIVNVRGEGGMEKIAEYGNMDEFDAKHDLGAYPVRRAVTYEGTTLILVGSKPWAGKVVVLKKERVGKSKIQVVADLLLQAGGCTTADILAATGWPSVSVPKQAQLAGLVLRKEKVDKVMRYWGTKK